MTREGGCLMDVRMCNDDKLKLRGGEEGRLVRRFYEISSFDFDI